MNIDISKYNLNTLAGAKSLLDKIKEEHDKLGVKLNASEGAEEKALKEEIDTFARWEEKITLLVDFLKDRDERQFAYNAKEDQMKALGVKLDRAKKNKKKPIRNEIGKLQSGIGGLRRGINNLDRAITKAHRDIEWIGLSPVETPTTKQSKEIDTEHGTIVPLPTLTTDDNPKTPSGDEEPEEQSFLEWAMEDAKRYGARVTADALEEARKNFINNLSLAGMRTAREINIAMNDSNNTNWIRTHLGTFYSKKVTTLVCEHDGCKKSLRSFKGHGKKIDTLTERLEKVDVSKDNANVKIVALQAKIVARREKQTCSSKEHTHCNFTKEDTLVLRSGGNWALNALKSPAWVGIKIGDGMNSMHTGVQVGINLAGVALAGGLAFFGFTTAAWCLGGVVAFLIVSQLLSLGAGTVTQDEEADNTEATKATDEAAAHA